MNIQTKEEKLEILKKEIAGKYTVTDLTKEFKKTIGLAMKISLLFEGDKDGLLNTFNLAMFNLTLDNATPTQDKPFNKNDKTFILEVKKDFYGITTK